MSSLPSISDLVDLRGVDYRNLELIVKRAVEYVETIKSGEREVIGLGFKRIPSHEPGAVTISLTRSGKGRETNRYLPPETYRDQLTIACFLFAVAKLSGVGNKANILCSDSRGRGDTENSISTKHPKSKLQERLTGILENVELVDGYKKTTLQDLPDGLTDTQRQLVRRATSGKVLATALSEVMRSSGRDQIGVYLEWERMKLMDSLDQSLVPTSIEFRDFSIHEVVSLIESGEMVRLKDLEIESWKNELFKTRRILEELRNRGLWRRILNR